MICYDPYTTSLGAILNPSKAKLELQKYLINTNISNLNYEYRNNDSVKLVFITGCNEDEKALPMWNAPLLVNNTKEEPHVCIDLRKYVKTINEQPLNLTDIIKDKSACNFLITAAIFTADMLDNNFGEYRKYFNTITSAYGYLISYLVDNIIKLNPVEHVETEVLLAWLANVMLLPSKDVKEYEPAIAARLTTAKFSIPVNKKTIDNVLTNYANSEEYIITLDTIVNNIKLVLPEEKADLLTKGILINSVSNIWYGPGANETVIMSLEHMGLWIALIYSSLSDQTYKKSRLASILDKHSRNLQGKDFVKAMDLLIENRKM